jgi:ribosomal protein S18 acetylase RimI-like enzyme
VEFDEEYWEEKHLSLEALEGNEIVGALTGDLMAGVLYIPELIIKQDNKGKGIGKSLLNEAEKWLKDRNGHEIYLVTGEKWPAKGFYIKLGFYLVADLPKHYSKTDFVLFRKFIS